MSSLQDFLTVELSVWTIIILFSSEKCYADLEGENMKIAELNKDMNAEKLKIFECPEGINCEVGNPIREPSCVERKRTLGLNNTDQYIIVDAEPGRTIQLECHYCNEQDDTTIHKVWHYYEKFLPSKRFKTVPLHLDYPEEARKFVVDDHDFRLSIRNFAEADGALYFCQRLNDASSKFNFLVDAVGQSSELEPKRGTFEDYLEYYKDNIARLNKKLHSEYKKDFKNWFSNSAENFRYNISHKWSKWGKCRSCGRDHGVRMRTGTCQLEIPGLSSEDEGSAKSGTGMLIGYKFSCHSAMLKRFLTSSLRKGVNAILDFIEELPCDEECSLPRINFENDESDALTAQDSISKQPLTVLGTVGEKVTLLCSENPSVDILWLKNNTLLTLPGDGSGKRSKEMTYTRNRGGLYFPSLTVSDEGNYTCIQDDLVKVIFKLETQLPVGDPPIPETWIWLHFAAFSAICLVIWIVIVIFIARVTWRTQAKYVPVSSAEETFLERKQALMEGYDA